MTRDHRAASAALTADQRLLRQTPTAAYHSPDVVRCRRLLLRKLAGALLLLWEGAPLQRSQPIKEFLARGAAKRLPLEQLPGYAPDLHPLEGLWNSLKCREWGTVCCRDFAELDTALRRAKARRRHKRHVLRGCIAECGYYLSSSIQASVDTGAEVLCAADTSCLMHIGGGLHRLRAGVRAMHLAEILASVEGE